ncbi:hypothetical protein [Streptomyces monashensis]|uniref:hypothetical protein n=1 Tax=Streptomyces monashensis TaxID=1678012 RepID=UPI0015A5D6DD|nr:hypothetical protein [Streptomyces monashensis]
MVWQGLDDQSRKAPTWTHEKPAPPPRGVPNGPLPTGKAPGTVSTRPPRNGNAVFAAA